MIPLIPTLALALVSFMSSAFIILRIVITLLPPSPLSRRVPPSEFGLSNFRNLSPADKSHLWLVACDLLALALFVWQAVQESLGGPSDYADASDPASAVRLWLAMTIRQTCLLVIACITLLHVRRGRPVSLGSKHWILWAPTLLIAVTSTGVAGVLAGAGVNTFFFGIVSFSTAVAVVTSVAFGWLITTLVIIKRNLAALSEHADSWPQVREAEDKPRPLFGTEDIDAMRDGSSWVTSNASSRHDSVSNWSFSTHTNHMSRHGSLHGNPATASHPSIPAKSFNPATFTRESSVPPLPLPSPIAATSTILGNNPDQFSREAPTPPRVRPGSQGSWLTSPSASQVTLSQWSYPTTHPDASAPDLRADLPPVAPPLRATSPAMTNAQVLGGYNVGYVAGSNEPEKGLAPFAVANSSEIDVSFYRAIGWLIAVWVPLGLALPYFFLVSPSGTVPPLAVNILLSVSVTISSPILALNLLCRSPLPIPTGLFDMRTGSLPTTMPSRSQQNGLDNYASAYKRSGSVTLVEGRRSGDIWLSNGDAVDGKTKFGRAVEMLAPAPKLSVLPPEEFDEDGEITPPSPLQMDDSPSFGVPTPQSQNSAELGSMRSLAYSAGEESLAYGTKIMVAQKNYSTLAQTVIVPAPEHGPSIVGATGAVDQHSKGHLRTRSISSTTRPKSTTAAPTAPPSSPLPPTLLSIKNARCAKMGHKKSHSSGAFSPSAIDDANEIDAMTAGLLPLLIPGLKIGGDMKVRGSISPADTFNKASQKVSPEFGALGASEEFESPKLHSTPARRKETRSRKISGHKRNHYSLPSLGLGREGVHSLAMWKAELDRVLESQVGKYATVPNSDLVRRVTVGGGGSTPSKAHFKVVQEKDERASTPTVPSRSHLGRSPWIRSLGLHAVASVSMDSVESVATMSSNANPPSAASTITLFDFEAGLGPQAESTPYDDQKKNHPTSKKAPPRNPLPTTHTRRSSIIYIKSDDDPPANPITSPRSFSRAVRQLVPKGRILQRNLSSDTKPGSPGGGLRPLSLLQDRDSNRPMTSPGGTRPLFLGKKKEQLKIIRDDENVLPSPTGRNFKQLQLARSETSKQRGVYELPRGSLM